MNGKATLSRRLIFALAGLLIAVLLAGAYANAQTKYHINGLLYLDMNQNGEWDEGEEGYKGKYGVAEEHGRWQWRYRGAAMTVVGRNSGPNIAYNVTTEGYRPLPDGDDIICIHQGVERPCEGAYSFGTKVKGSMWDIIIAVPEGYRLTTKHIQTVTVGDDVQTADFGIVPHVIPMADEVQPIYDISSGSIGDAISGAQAHLVRDDDSISVTFDTTTLPVGHVVTLWAYTFNDPTACLGGCNIDDMFVNAATPPTYNNPDGTVGRPGVDFSLMGLGGVVVGENGTHTFTGSIDKGTAPQVVFGNGLNRPLAAEIHFALRDHGPASEDADLLEEQLTVGAGGCKNFGGTGDYTCVDFQLALMGQQNAPEAVDSTNLLASIVNAPIVPDGTLTGAFPDFVINFDVDMNPAVAGRTLATGKQIRIIMPDDFESVSDPQGGDAFAAKPFDAYSWAALLQGWPQVPIFSSFPPGNLETGDIRYTVEMEGTHTMVITALTDLNGELNFPGPGIKQIHALFAHLRNPAPGSYPIEVIAETGPNGAEERGVVNMEVVTDLLPTLAFTSVFNGQGRPNALYQTAEVGQIAPIPFHLLAWNENGDAYNNLDISPKESGESIISHAGKAVGKVIVTGPDGAEGHFAWTESFQSEEITAPISDQPASHVIALGAIGDTPGLYTFEFLLNDGNSLTTYVEATAATSPGYRTWHGATYNENDDTLIMGGGRNLGCTPPCLSYEDTWTFDTVTGEWEKILDIPDAIELDMSVFDPDNNQLVILGGYKEPGPKLFAYDLDTSDLTIIDMPEAYAQRIGPGTVYHAEAEKIVIFGGQSIMTPTHNDTWIFDTETHELTEIETDVAPRSRGRFAMVYDSDANRILVHGGSSGHLFEGALLSDTWEFDMATKTWSEIETTVSPKLQAQVTGAYDTQSQKFIVFGRSMSQQQETWAFDYATSTWEQMNPATEPMVNHPGNAVYSSELDRMLVYGGNINWPQSGLTTNELWAYDYDNDAWELFTGETWEVPMPPEDGS